jgi:integrase
VHVVLHLGQPVMLLVEVLKPALRRTVRVEQTVQWANARTWYVETPKSATSRRTVPQIPPAIMADLQAMINERALGPEDWLFGEDGRPLYWEHFYRRHFKPAARDVLGLPSLRPHDLRGTFASLMAEELGLFATSRRLGHSSVKVTERHYARVFERENTEQGDRLAAREAAARARRYEAVTPLRAE